LKPVAFLYLQLRQIWYVYEAPQRIGGPGRKLLLFEFSEDCEPDIKRFVHRNFGTYYKWFDPNAKQMRREGWLERLLPKIQTLRLPISDRNHWRERLLRWPAGSGFGHAPASGIEVGGHLRAIRIQPL
jgi:hypothetical protein